MRSRRGWIPLVSTGMAYGGFLVGIGTIALITTPEYEHISRLHFGLIGLAWSLLALVSIAVTATSLVLTVNHLRRWVRSMVVALNIPLAIAVGASLPYSISNLEDYAAGPTAYQAAVHACGHPPVLASAGWGGDILLPGDSEYDRLKYSTADHLLLGVPVFFCTLADAKAHGYRRQTWH